MKKILVVDDEPMHLKLICEYLIGTDYTTVTASDGKEALNKVEKNKPDLIITDWMMPNMGGLDLCRKLRKNADTADIPVIAYTAKDKDVDRMWAMKQGVKAYITKPCTKEELLSTINLIMK